MAYESLLVYEQRQSDQREVKGEEWATIKYEWVLKLEKIVRSEERDVCN